jgi:hypothetical protein
MDPTTAAASGSPSGIMVQRKAMDVQKMMALKLVQAAAQGAQGARDSAQFSAESVRRLDAERR